MRQVLIVDDDTIVRITLHSLVDWEALGYQVVADAIHGDGPVEGTSGGFGDYGYENAGDGRNWTAHADEPHGVKPRTAGDAKGSCAQRL